MQMSSTIGWMLTIVALVKENEEKAHRNGIRIKAK